MMGGAYPELASSASRSTKWLAAEEEGFGRTLAQGTKLLDELIASARQRGAEGIAARGRLSAARHLRLPLRADHASWLAEEGLSVDEEGFERLMEGQRARSRGRSSGVAADQYDEARGARARARRADRFQHAVHRL